MIEEPRFWGSWKGRVIKAIAVDRAHHWEEIRDITGLFEKPLNKALAEMFSAGILHKRVSDSTYWVTDDIFAEYKDFFRKNSASMLLKESSVRFSEEKQKDLINWIDRWRELKRLDFSLEQKHFFLEGNDLDDISEELILIAKNEVLVVNPFVEHCNISNTLGVF